jgi:hypothetical protein
MNLAAGLVVKDDFQQGIIDMQAGVVRVVVIDEAELAKFVHKEADPAAGGADHFGQGVLGNVGNDLFGFVDGAVASHQEKSAGEAFFAGVEELVDEVFFDADVALEHVGDKTIGEGVFVVKYADHFVDADLQGQDGFRGGGGGDAEGLAGDTTFAAEISGNQRSDDGFFSFGRIDADSYGAGTDVYDRTAGIALFEDDLVFLKSDDLSGNPSGFQVGIDIESERLSARFDRFFGTSSCWHRVTLGR